MYIRFFKRFLDIVLSLSGIIVLAFPMLVVSVVIKIDSRGPILFKQRRIGKGKSEFLIYKFRSMKADVPKDVPTHLFTDSENYMTGWQKFIRKVSIDELPQLFNILKGDMSVVGPRPALWNQFDLIEERDKYGANDVRPGLTGWAQINGRDELEIPIKARFDGEYIEKMSFLFDCKCFFGTFIKVIRADGVVEGRTATDDVKFEEKEVVTK